MLLGFSGSFVLFVVLVSSTPIAAQENPPAAKPPCIAADEPIYRPGADGVKPGQPQPDKNAKNPPDIRGSMSLELLVNSEGRVCDVRIVNATDRLSAQKNANFILEHWTFKPATRQGKPVAVKLTMTLNNPR
jgi:TonB family protein